MNDTTSNPATETSSSSALAAPGEVLQVFSGIAAFDAAQRMARALCSSSLVPRDYQGQQGLANSLIALEIAARMRLSPLVVMQNMTPIHGRPTWSSKFLIATVNASGRFSPLRFVFDDKENPSRCHAVATDKATGEVLEGETITLELARKEGWWSRKDRNGNETSKWQTMTGQMLRYRAAAWWANVYCPEIALGLITQEEALDIEAVAR
jgi:RecT family